MDTQLILKTLKKRWLLYLAVFVVTAAATLALTMIQTPVFKSKATYITRLNPAITDDRGITSALDTLNRQDQMLGNYSEIAMSQKIKDLAAQQLTLLPVQQRGFTVSSRTIPGTRILEISVLGDDPRKVRDFTTAVGDQTMKYVNSLYTTYQLDLLDPADTPGRQVSPKLELNLMLALALGLFFGGGTLFFSTWLTTRANPAPVVKGEESVVKGEWNEVYAPVKMEISELQKLFEGLRIQLEETQRVIHATQEDAQLLSTRIKKLPKSENGSGRKKVNALDALDEQPETEIPN